MEDQFGPFAQFVTPQSAAAAQDFGPFAQFVQGGQTAHPEQPLSGLDAFLASENPLAQIPRGINIGAQELAGKLQSLLGDKEGGRARLEKAQAEAQQSPALASGIASLGPSAPALLAGGPFVAGAGRVAQAAFPAATKLGELLTASLGRTVGGAALGGAQGAFDTAGTDQNTAQKAIGGALLGGVIQGGGEAIPGAYTGAKAYALRQLDKLKGTVPPPPAVDPAILAAARQRGFTPHPGTVESPEEVALRDAANRERLSAQIGSEVGRIGGPISEQEGATALGGLLRPAIKSYGEQIGSRIGQIEAGGRANVSPETNPDYANAIRAAIEREKLQIAPDAQFLNIANRALVGEAPNPEFESIIESALKNKRFAGDEASFRALLRKEGKIPEFVKISGLPGYQAATDTVPNEVLQANITRFGQRAAESTAAHSREGYGALTQALKDVLDKGLDPQAAAELDQLRKQYTKFSQFRDSISNAKDTSLLERMASGDTQALDALQTMVPPSEQEAIRALIGRRVATGLQSDAQGGRPSVTQAAPANFEKLFHALSPEARSQFLNKSGLGTLSDISAGLLAPQEEVALAPTGTLGKLTQKLLSATGGTVGATIASLLPGKHSLSGYAAGSSIGKDKGGALIRKLLNSPTPTIKETAPGLTNRVTPALIQALTILGGQ